MIGRPGLTLANQEGRALERRSLKVCSTFHGLAPGPGQEKRLFEVVLALTAESPGETVNRNLVAAVGSFEAFSINTEHTAELGRATPEAGERFDCYRRKEMSTWSGAKIA